MTGKLFAQAMGKFFAGIVLLGVLIFLPAGTLLFRNGWLLMEILFIPLFAPSASSCGTVRKRIEKGSHPGHVSLTSSRAL